jgi:hypothetical protein
MIDYNFRLEKVGKQNDEKYVLPRNKPSVLDNYRYDLEFQEKLRFDKWKYGVKE